MSGYLGSYPETVGCDPAVRALGGHNRIHSHIGCNGSHIGYGQEPYAWTMFPAQSKPTHFEFLVPCR